MKNLTLTQLRKAVKVVGTSDKFRNPPTGTKQALLRAVTYMTDGRRLGLPEPRDPREVLTAIGYEW